MPHTLLSIEQHLSTALEKRKDAGLLRALQVQEGLVDFCSNDYLGFARSQTIRERAHLFTEKIAITQGSTGSRSISGNTLFAEELEAFIAKFHRAEAGLLFNSGYDANVGLFSCIAGKNETLICDELIHASIIDGCRLSHASRFKFAHNDLNDLEQKLKAAKGNTFVAVESVYSMDGDEAPLIEMANLCERYNAALIVDEAHATGVFGPQGEGLVLQHGLEQRVFARIHTFGKALGAHGAIVVGSQTLRNYLINFARSFIFTTALPLTSLGQIKSAYSELAFGNVDRKPLLDLIAQFRREFKPVDDVFLIDSRSPVQCIVIPGNERARRISRGLQQSGFDVRAILSPSVPQGKERLRISLHLHNTPTQLQEMLTDLHQLLQS
jgi:8-amino-7-oxononanoate synthase